MKKTTGHLVRICGLLIEMLGVWGVFSSGGAKDSARLHFSGGNEIPVPWLAVGVGFLLWFAGTIIVYFSGPTRKTRSDRFDNNAGEPLD
jgi:hypothetical protein